MEPTRADVVKLSGPADLVAAVPHLLGFVPTESIVLMSLRGPRQRVGLTLRFDLAPPASDIAVARGLAHRIRQDNPDSVTIVVLTEAADEDDTLPRRALVDAVRKALWVPLEDAILVRDGRWWSYRCQNPRCCPPEGTPLDGASAGAVAVAAAHAIHGRSVLPDRDAVVRSVAPVCGPAAMAVEQAHDRIIGSVIFRTHEERKAKLLALVTDLIERYADPRALVSVDDAATIALSCTDVHARDALLGLMLDDEEEDRLRRLRCVPHSRGWPMPGARALSRLRP
jgi:hypothetical protein